MVFDDRQQRTMTLKLLIWRQAGPEARGEMVAYTRGGDLP